MRYENRKERSCETGLCVLEVVVGLRSFAVIITRVLHHPPAQSVTMNDF
jgi:hypothetical protein